MKRLVLPLIAVGMLAACGSAASDSSDPAAAPAATSASAGSAPGAASSPIDSGVPANIPEALKFAAPLVGGGDIELTTLAGRPVLLWFWAPW